jgi:hypothetical protein
MDLVYAVLRENCLENISGNGWILLQPANGIRVPLSPERHIDSNAITIRSQLQTQLLFHSKQHLELILVWTQTSFSDDSS